MRPWPCALLALLCAAASIAPVAAYRGLLENPFQAKDFVTSLPVKGEIGPAGMAFVGDYLYVLDHSSSCLYRFSAAHGGSAGGNSRSALACYDQTPGGAGYTGISADASGQRLFLAQQEPGSVFEVDPETGHVIDTVASGMPGVSALAADQVYGDLFAVQSSADKEDTVFKFRFRSVPTKRSKKINRKLRRRRGPKSRRARKVRRRILKRRRLLRKKLRRRAKAKARRAHRNRLQHYISYADQKAAAANGTSTTAAPVAKSAKPRRVRRLRKKRALKARLRKRKAAVRRRRLARKAQRRKAALKRAALKKTQPTAVRKISPRTALRKQRALAKRTAERKTAARVAARRRAYRDSSQAGAEADTGRWSTKVVIKRIYSRLMLQGGKKVMASAQDGTLYVASNDAIVTIPFSRRQLAPNYRIITGLKDIAGITVSSDKKRLMVNHRGGKITEINLTNMTSREILRDGARGDCIAFGPDGCIYASQTDGILRISTQPDGSCAGDFGPNPEAYRRSMVHWISEQGVKMQTEQQLKTRRRKGNAQEEVQKNSELDYKAKKVQSKKARFDAKQQLLDEQQNKLDAAENKLRAKTDEEEFKLDVKSGAAAKAVRDEEKAEALAVKQRLKRKQQAALQAVRDAEKQKAVLAEKKKENDRKAVQEQQAKTKAELATKAKSEVADKKTKEMAQKKDLKLKKDKADAELKKLADEKKKKAEIKSRLQICTTNPCHKGTDVCMPTAAAPYYNCTNACKLFDINKCPDTHKCRARNHAARCTHACSAFGACRHHSWTSLCVGQAHVPVCADPCATGDAKSGNAVCKEFGMACVADRSALVKYRCVKCARHMAGKKCDRHRQVVVGGSASTGTTPVLLQLTSSAAAPSKVTGTQIAVSSTTAVPAINIAARRGTGEIFFTTGFLNIVYKATLGADGRYSALSIFARLGTAGFAHGIAVGPRGSVFVTSRTNDRIFRLSSNGTIVSSVSTSGICSRPAGITLSPTKKRLFVACSAHKDAQGKPSIALYTLNLKSGKKFISHKLLHAPASLVFDSDRTLYISNFGSGPDSNATLVRIGALPSNTVPGVPNPKNFVAAKTNSAKGRKVSLFATVPAAIGRGLAVDGQDQVYWSVQAKNGDKFVMQYPPNYSAKPKSGRISAATKIAMTNAVSPAGIAYV